MAFTKITVNSSEWTLLSEGSSASFENVGQMGTYILATSSNTQPDEEFGWVYPSFSGELKRPLEDLTFETSPNYLWGKSISKESSIIVEEE